MEIDENIEGEVGKAISTGDKFRGGGICKAVKGKVKDRNNNEQKTVAQNKKKDKRRAKNKAGKKSRRKNK